jgi:dsDNA-specific endonuclease/ATPase MutS2
VQVSEDYISVVFSLKNTERMDETLRELDNHVLLIEAEELVVREKLSKEIGEFTNVLLENCAKIGELDLAIAKVMYASGNNCVIPEISDEFIFEVTDGRHIPAYDALISKGKRYCPVSISVSNGVTCITGANMGGKTVSLKLIGLVALLAQNAFFVPCTKAVLGLSNYVQILIGDSQSLERGLSSFGGEVEELKEILDSAKDKSLILIDEIASGTNPSEGFALTKGLVEYLKNKPYISILTTHYDGVAAASDVNNLQVVGLANVDFDKLNEEISRADKLERVDIIAAHMDYRLRSVTKNIKVPRDAINIAKMLGINEEIIENAKKHI